jgi:hypothetical protein
VSSSFLETSRRGPSYSAKGPRGTINLPFFIEEVHPTGGFLRSPRLKLEPIALPYSMLKER